MSIVIDTQCLVSEERVQVEVWSDGSFSFLDYDLEADALEHELGGEVTLCYAMALGMEKPDFFIDILLEQELSEYCLKLVMNAAIWEASRPATATGFVVFRKALREYLDAIMEQRFNYFIDINAEEYLNRERSYLKSVYGNAKDSLKAIISSLDHLGNIAEEFSRVVRFGLFPTIVKSGKYHNILQRVVGIGGTLASRLYDGEITGEPLDIERMQESYNVQIDGQNAVYLAAIKALVECLEAEAG